MSFKKKLHDIIRDLAYKKARNKISVEKYKHISSYTKMICDLHEIKFWELYFHYQKLALRDIERERKSQMPKQKTSKPIVINRKNLLKKSRSELDAEAESYLSDRTEAITDLKNNFLEFVRRALSNKQHKENLVLSPNDIGCKLFDGATKVIDDDTAISSTVLLTSDFIRHVHKKHGSTNELKRGQLPIQNDAYAFIIDLLVNPTDIKNMKDVETNKPTMRFNDGIYVESNNPKIGILICVEGIRKNGVLEPINFFIKIKGTELSDALLPRLNAHTRNSVLNNNNDTNGNLLQDKFTKMPEDAKIGDVWIYNKWKSKAYAIIYELADTLEHTKFLTEEAIYEGHLLTWEYDHSKGDYVSSNFRKWKENFWLIQESGIDFKDLKKLQEIGIIGYKNVGMDTIEYLAFYFKKSDDTRKKNETTIHSLTKKFIYGNPTKKEILEVRLKNLKVWTRPMYPQPKNLGSCFDIVEKLLKSDDDSILSDRPKNQKFNDAFWKWFGNSKVVDEQGEPLVVYHGTNADFDSFSKAKIGTTTDWGFYGRGFYFSSDRKGLTHFQNLKKCYLKITNPYYIDVDEFSWLGDEESSIDFTNQLIAKGYDGIILFLDNDSNETGTKDFWVVAFSPNQIKSATGNDGTWDADDDSILSDHPKAKSKKRWQDEVSVAERYKEMYGVWIDRIYKKPSYYLQIEQLLGIYQEMCDRRSKCGDELKEYAEHISKVFPRKKELDNTSNKEIVLVSGSTLKIELYYFHLEKFYSMKVSYHSSISGSRDWSKAYTFKDKKDIYNGILEHSNTAYWG